MLNPLSGVNKIINGIRIFLEVVCGCLLIGLTAVVFAQVFNRFVLHGTFAWAEEAAIYMMIWMVFLGASINILKGSNIKIDFFTRLLPARIQYLLDFACQLICMGFTGYMCQKSWMIIQLNRHNLAPGIRIPIAVMYAGLTISAILMILFFIWQAVQDLRLAMGKGGDVE